MCGGGGVGRDLHNDMPLLPIAEYQSPLCTCLSKALLHLPELDRNWSNTRKDLPFAEYKANSSFLTSFFFSFE